MQCHAMDARAIQSDGLESAVNRQDRPRWTLVDPGLPAGVEAPGEHQVARTVVLDGRRRAVPRDQPRGPRIGTTGDQVFGQEPGGIPLIRA